MQIKYLYGSAGKSLMVISALAFALAFMFDLATLKAYDGQDNITLDLNISQSAAIEVLPTSITWAQIQPGANGSVYNLSIKNIGSYNLTSFYIYVNTKELETENPVGMGNINKYAASGLMWFRNETDTLQYFPLGRLEWNLSEIMDTEILSLNPATSKYAHGWYRLANGNEYLWKIENGTNDTNTGLYWCNNSAVVFKILKYPENSSSYSRDFGVGANVATATVSYNNSNWTFVYFPTGQAGPLVEDCIAIWYDCSKIYLYKYDMSAGFKECADAKYLTAEIYAPGERIDKLKIKPSVPFGTPSGDTITSTMTVYTSIQS